MLKKFVDRWFKDGVSFDIVKSKYVKCIYDVGMNKVEVMEKDMFIISCMVVDGYCYGVFKKEF